MMPIEKPDAIGNDMSGAVSLRDFLRSHTDQQAVISADRQDALDRLFMAKLEAIEQRFVVRIEAREAAAFAMQAAQEKAINKAETASEKRFDAVNEFRASLNDIITRLMPRAEAINRFDLIERQIENMTARLNLSEGAGAGIRSGWAILVGLIGVVGVGVAIFATVAARVGPG